MERGLTVVQPLAGTIDPSRFAGDPGAWLPTLEDADPRPAGPDAWRIVLHVGGVERRVVCHVGAPWRTAEGIRRRIAWEAMPLESDIVGGDRLLPSFDGELVLAGPASATSLLLTGDVRLPLGAVGRAVDALVLGRVADRGAQTFVREVAARLVPQHQPIGTHHRS